MECDTTCDNSDKDQASVVIRYLNANCEVQERMIGFKHSKDGTGKGMFDLIIDCLEQNGLEIANIIGYSFDGASAMRSDNKGCNAYLKEINPDAIYTWCYSHRLNLAVNDSCESNTKIKGVLGLVQETSNF